MDLFWNNRACLGLSCPNKTCKMDVHLWLGSKVFWKILWGQRKDQWICAPKETDAALLLRDSRKQQVLIFKGVDLVRTLQIFVNTFQSVWVAFTSPRFCTLAMCA